MQTNESLDTVTAEVHNAILWIDIRQQGREGWTYTCYIYDIKKARRVLSEQKHIDTTLKLAAFQRLERLELEWQQKMEKETQEIEREAINNQQNTPLDIFGWLSIFLAACVIWYSVIRLLGVE